MLKRWILICLLVCPMAVLAQDADETQEPATVDYAFGFPLEAPTHAQIDEAYGCVLDESSDNDELGDDATACNLANLALSMAAERGDEDPSGAELDLFHQLIAKNPALALRLDMIAVYFNTPALVAPPEATLQTITAIHLTYTFSGLGPSNDYDITITNADKTPKVSGTVELNGSMRGSDSEATDEAPLTLPKTVDALVVQALAPALSDLLPIAEQFSSVPCWDYYPDWTVELTFADKTTLMVVTNQSNIVGIGGPWQVDIEDQTYMQYSGAFAGAVIDVFDALELPLGETAAMGCGDVNDPLYDAFPRTDGSNS